MKRFMLHLKNRNYSPKDVTRLLYRARELVESGGVVVRDARVSKKYIEYDFSVPDNISEKVIVGKLKSISPLASIEEVAERHLAKEDAIKLAIQSFNDEKYWNAHELLEGAWKPAKGAERSILNGIILVAAAFVHDEKDESDICISILRRALTKLESGHGIYFGIDIDNIATDVTKIIDSGKITRFTI